MPGFSATGGGNASRVIDGAESPRVHTLQLAEECCPKPINALCLQKAVRTPLRCAELNGAEVLRGRRRAGAVVLTVFRLNELRYSSDLDGYLGPPNGLSLSCTARAHAPKPTRHDGCRQGVAEPRLAFCNRRDAAHSSMLTNRLGRRASAGP